MWRNCDFLPHKTINLTFCHKPFYTVLIFVENECDYVSFRLFRKLVTVESPESISIKIVVIGV